MKNGRLIVTFTAFYAHEQRISISDDGGLSFGPERRVATLNDFSPSLVPGSFQVAPFVINAVDPLTQRIYVVYADSAVKWDNMDVLLRHSDDGGQTWSEPIVVNGDGQPPGDQFLPWIDVDGKGRVHVLYFDTRRNPIADSSPSALVDVYYAVSEDGGASFKELRLTADPIDSSKTNWSAHQPGKLQWLGDYLGMASAGDSVYLAYPKMEDDLARLFVSRIDFDDDLIFRDGFAL